VELIRDFSLNETGLAVFFGILLIVVLIGAVHFTWKWVRRYERLRKGIEEITNGNLDYKIEISEGGKNEFERLSIMVNELGSAQNTAIQNELKNQRLKTDLISNVSHDLKTPLTSIITYTDLLKTEGLKSKNAEEYLNIIEEKGKRLQKLTEDLFDAAKASSGAIQMRKEKVDLLALINQEIAEFNGSFEDAGLELLINAEKEHYYVEADSQLLWRVVDNLLRNVRNYALHGTRVYIDFKEHQKEPSLSSGTLLMTTLDIKNISAVKLNVPPEELMERFKRGDEARATDGSGLGLAISKDLVRLMGGWFEIFIDGDLFKVVVMLPPYMNE
jgi:signal transduction histidine kinase